MLDKIWANGSEQKFVLQHLPPGPMEKLQNGMVTCKGMVCQSLNFLGVFCNTLKEKGLISLPFTIRAVYILWGDRNNWSLFVLRWILGHGDAFPQQLSLADRWLDQLWTNQPKKLPKSICQRTKSNLTTYLSIKICDYRALCSKHPHVCKSGRKIKVSANTLKHLIYFSSLNVPA